MGRFQVEEGFPDTFDGILQLISCHLVRLRDGYQAESTGPPQLFGRLVEDFMSGRPRPEPSRDFPANLEDGDHAGSGVFLMEGATRKIVAGIRNRTGLGGWKL